MNVKDVGEEGGCGVRDSRETDTVAIYSKRLQTCSDLFGMCV